MSDQVFWYATRAAAIVAWFAANLSVMVGVLMSSRFLGRRPTLPWLTDLHRFFGGMALLFVGVHMVTLWADDFISFSWTELLVPWSAQIRGVSRLALAMGVVAAWIMAAVEATSLVKRQLPARFWHGVHLSSYAMVVLSTIHGWMVGSDASNPLLFSLSASMLAAVTFVTAIRLLRFLDDRKRRYEQVTSGAVASGGGPGRRAGPARHGSRPDPDRPMPPDPRTVGAADPNRPVPPDPRRGVATLEPDPNRPVPPDPRTAGTADPNRPVPPPPPANVELAAWPPGPADTTGSDPADGLDRPSGRPPAPSHRSGRHRRPGPGPAH